MDFNHTEERRMLADTLARFAGEHHTFDLRHTRAGSSQGDGRALWSRYAELGAVAALFHEADGGMGGAGFDISAVFESLGRSLVAEPFLGALLAGSAIAHAGSAAQKARLEPLIGGEQIYAMAHAEPETHYELSLVRTRAVPAGEGWCLNGSKAVVEYAEDAGLFVVSARTSGNEDDEDGISLFMIPADAPGLKVRGYALIDGGRAGEVVLDDVHVGADTLLGGVGMGYPTLEYAVGRGLLALCAEAVGAMDVACEATLEYLRTRKQFGVPIGSFQAIQHRMADLLLEIEQARSSVVNAAARLDDPDRRVRERALSAAKFTIGRVGVKAAEEFIQLHGGIGMSWELPLSHYAKRLVMIDHVLGDEDHHLERYIVLGRLTP